MLYLKLIIQIIYLPQLSFRIGMESIQANKCVYAIHKYSQAGSYPSFSLLIEELFWQTYIITSRGSLTAFSFRIRTKCKFMREKKSFGKQSQITECIFVKKKTSHKPHQVFEVT